MNRYARHQIVLLTPLLLMTACGGSQHTTRLLDQRLQTQLAPGIAAGTVVLQPLPDGARVTLLDTSDFPNDVRILDNRQADVRASIIEGLLDPSLMRIQVADNSALTDERRATRVLNVNQYFIANGLQSTLQPAAVTPAVTPGSGTPAGLTITIGVQCPDQSGGSGYDSGKSKPICD